ncbi:Cif family virulence factor [Paludisphaera rhizosphaerae]|uniref:hypothetical protein n=1 Tax=Paludisphaera rhizosphaerae TaxID=2711216 RepID=UPI0013EE0B43|nr:hypothetical protein [Paludisphaera rhizosphaerae]
MNRIFPALAATLLALAPTAFADDEAQARKIAEKVTADGAAIFDTLDAHAMAATYDEKGVLTMFMKDQGGEIERKVYEGRRDVEAAYADLFKNPETIKSRNTVDRARLIAPDVLTIDGTFNMNTLKPDSIKVPFHQVRREQGGKWLVLSMEIVVVPPK